MKNQFSKKGFSLVETLVVLSVFGLLAGFVLTTLNNSRNEISLKDAQTTLISSLEQARNRAAAGVGSGAHGVYIDAENNEIWAFEGEKYEEGASENKKIYFSFHNLISSTTEIIFNRLSGTATDTEIILENKDESKKIIIEPSGRIKSE